MNPVLQKDLTTFFFIDIPLPSKTFQLKLLSLKLIFLKTKYFKKNFFSI